MSERGRAGGVDRRTFLRNMAGLGGAVLVAGCGGGGDALPAVAGGEADSLATASTARWADRAGIQLYTVRDLTETDLEGTLAQLAQIGFREVEPTGYGSYTPQQYREILDRVGLTAPSTHANLIPGPDLERQLEGYAVIGHRYARAATRAPGQEGEGPQNTEEGWKERAAIYNQIGQTASTHGIKVLLHNHAGEFAPLEGSTLRPQDILLAETDPEYVVFELDIGWSSVAGQDTLEIFRAHPGRYPLWHIKDVTGLSAMTPEMTMQERQRAASMAKVGEGEIDWRPIFDQAELAGLEHYFLEIEGEAVADGSLEASRVSYQNLQRMLA